MIIPPFKPNHGPSLGLMECGLALISIAAALTWPQLASAQFTRIERAFRRLALKKVLSVFIVGLTAMLLRVAMIPLFPIPLPFVPDDYSFLLAADTFASGRLTNPTPAMWKHFESIHITMNPTYMSMYFPGHGLVLAAGKVVFGNPWFGILLVTTLMCSAICWMLQAWLPPTWALLGGMLAVLRIGLFSYWIDTYHGGGSLVALGGALVLGSLPRIKRSMRFHDWVLLATGMVLLAISRPFEGILLCVPVTVALLHWLLFGENRPTAAKLIRYATLPLLMIIAAGSWMAYYNSRAFGSPLTPPYSVDRATYAVAPYYVWQSARPEPVYRHAVMRDFYAHYEYDDFKHIHSLSGFIPQTMIKVARAFEFYAGFVLLIPLIMLRRVILDRRIRFLMICVLVLMVGMLIEIFMIAHYLAPFTAAFYAIGLQAMRHLRVWSPFGRPAGMTVVRLIVLVCCVMASLRLCSAPLQIGIAKWPASKWLGMWYGPDLYGKERAGIENNLERLPGKQLVIVRYKPGHNPFEEWVYNAANVDGSKVIWAREMDAADNAKLIEYYSDRRAWLIEPDLQNKLSPYSIPVDVAAAGQ
jgi:hypothetical protein